MAQRVVISPLFVATIQRPLWRAIDCTRPNPGTTSPAETPTTPLGPCKIAVPFITSRTTQPAIFFGSAGACDFSDDFGSGVGARAWTCAAFGSAAGVELLARAGCWFTLSAIALRSI